MGSIGYLRMGLQCMEEQSRFMSGLELQYLHTTHQANRAMNTRPHHPLPLHSQSWKLQLTHVTVMKTQ